MKEGGKWGKASTLTADNMGDSTKFKVPDWKSYKIDGIPQLEETQRLLAARGLRDPWLRNDVWRYTKENYGGLYRNTAVSVGCGLKWAVLALGLTIALNTLGRSEAGDHQRGMGD